MRQLKTFLPPPHKRVRSKLMVNPVSAQSFTTEVDKAKVPPPFDFGTENVPPRFLSQVHPTSRGDLRPYLHHFRVDPLPHFNSSMSHQHRPV